MGLALLPLLINKTHPHVLVCGGGQLSNALCNTLVNTVYTYLYTQQSRISSLCGCIPSSLGAKKVASIKM